MEMYSLNIICAVKVALRFLLCPRTFATSAIFIHGLVRTGFSLGSLTLSGNCSGIWFLAAIALYNRPSWIPDHTENCWYLLKGTNWYPPPPPSLSTPPSTGGCTKGGYQ